MQQEHCVLHHYVQCAIHYPLSPDLLLLGTVALVPSGCTDLVKPHLYFLHVWLAWVDPSSCSLSYHCVYTGHRFSLLDPDRRSHIPRRRLCAHGASLIPSPCCLPLHV